MSNFKQMTNKTFDITKFSWTELFLNTNGKTSSTKLIGLLTSFICLILFVIMFVFYMFNMAEAGTVIELIDRIITVFGISSGLMGIKSISSSIGNRSVNIHNADEGLPNVSIEEHKRNRD